MNSFDMAVIFLTDSVCDIYPTAEYQEIKKEARRILSQATKELFDKITKEEKKS